MANADKLIYFWNPPNATHCSEITEFHFNVIFFPLFELH